MLISQKDIDRFVYQYGAAKELVIDSTQYRRPTIDKNLTVGEIIDKGIVPEGMVATWSENARKKYNACVSPHIAAYKYAVDKAYRDAVKSYNQ